MEKRDEFRHRLLLTLSVVALCGIILLVVLRFSDDPLATFTYSAYEDGITVEGYSGNPSTLEVPEKIDGKTVVAISESAFTSQKKLKKVILPETVREIGATAFADCVNLAEVDAPGVRVIRIGAFQRCADLKKVTLSDELAVLEDRAFQGCGKLQALTAPKTLTEIGTDAFAGCGNLALDCKENPLAEEIAAQYGISTQVLDTGRGMWLRLGGTTLLMAGAVFVVWFVIARAKQRRKTGV